MSNKNAVVSKKIINNVNDTVEECLKGFSYLYPQLTLNEKHRFVSFQPERVSSKAEVALLSGGGSGHEPFATGYVGRGMLNGAVAGSVFTSPPSKNIFFGIKYLHQHYPGGVLVFIPNYTGDRLNFGMAIEKAKTFGLKVDSLILGEDLASESNTGTGSRGMCGMSVIYKMCGALAERGADMSTIQKTAIQFMENMSTFGASLTACSLPGQSPLFHVDHDKLELGIGVHGEAGVSSIPMCTSKQLVELLLKDLRKRLNLVAGSDVAIFINNLGAVSHLEMNIVCADAVDNLKSHGINVKRVYVGPIMTALDMVGIQICLLNIPKGTQWINLLDADTDAPAWIGRRVTIPNGQEKHIFSDDIEKEQLITGPKLAPDQINILKKCLMSCAEVMQANEEILNKLDSGCGDGDCGTTLKNLALGVKSYASSSDLSNPTKVFADLSELAESTMGGTSGGIYSLGFSAVSTTLSSAAVIDTLVWLNALRNAVSSISKYGGATKGDRSMMDTLIPALEAFEENKLKDTQSIMAAIVDAGEIGCAATATMRARVGRASYVSSDRASDRDAGSLAVLFWLKALQRTINNKKLRLT